MTDVNRSLLAPRWLALHLLFLAATVATGLLAWWQWERAHDAGGSLQNLGYALMWPLFGVFTLFLWHHLVRMHRQNPDHGAEAAASPQPEPTTVGRKRPLVPPPAPPVNADEDPELAAYNEYLAELNRADQRS